MTRPPPFSPLSVCPKPLPGPRPFGTRTPAQAAGSKPLLRPVFPTEDAKEQGYCLFYHIFPVNARALRLFLQRKPAQTICAGRERLSKLARACRHMQTPHSRRQFAATRRQNTAPAQGRSEADRATAQVGPPPPPPGGGPGGGGGGAPVRGRLTFHDSNRQPLRPSQRSSRSSRTLPSKRADGALIADPRTSAAAVAAFFAGPYDFSERFVLPSLAFP